ncbi:hypothetical protein Syun_019967 [Stephania yunnanensis]|uniref:Uncharacterized protein n=1 Tax=Stephania yunnanensis TaxID=152371 RepID=A0AAP0NYG2_9MAGN
MTSATVSTIAIMALEDLIKAMTDDDIHYENVDNAIAGHSRRDHLGIGRDRRLNFLTDAINKAAEQVLGKLKNDNHFGDPVGDFINQTGATVAGKAKEFFQNVGSGAKDFFQNVGGQVVNGARQAVMAFGGSSRLERQSIALAAKKPVVVGLGEARWWNLFAVVAVAAVAAATGLSDEAPLVLGFWSEV